MLRAADAVPMKLREDFDKNNDNVTLHEANLENIATEDVDMEITELQVDYNTIGAILDDTEDDLRDMKSDLHAAQKKIEHLKSDLMWKKFFNGLEAEDAKKEVADARQEAADARQ
jgi:chromosome segregation ATPase